MATLRCRKSRSNKLETVTLTTAGPFARRYLFWRPPGVVSPPVVLFLHGTGSTAEWAADECRLPLWAALNGYALCVPQALPPKPDEPIKFLTNPSRWNDGSPMVSPDVPALADDLGFLHHVIDDALAKLNTPGRRVYVCGFSNGAGMAFRLAAESAERIAALVPVAGHCWLPDPKPSRPVPTHYIIGTADPLLPRRGGEILLPWGNRLIRRPPLVPMLERWATAIGCEPISMPDADTPPGTTRERFVGPVEYRALSITDLGHHWPGGKGQLNPRLAGNAKSSCVANDLMHDFFRRHPIPF